MTLIPSSPPPFVAAEVRGIVFDLDGTLIDSYEAIAQSLNYARGQFRMPTLSTERVRGLVGHGLECLIAEQLGADRVDEGVRCFREHYGRVFLALTRALPGVGESIRELASRGYPMAVASNKPARFSRPILDQLGLLRCFAAVHGPDSTGATKPDPAMMRRCVAALGVPRETTVYVGDMLLDVETAARAEVPVLLVRGGSSDEEALRHSGQRLVDGVPDLLPLLDGAPKA